MVCFLFLSLSLSLPYFGGVVATESEGCRACRAVVKRLTDVHARGHHGWKEEVLGLARTELCDNAKGIIDIVNRPLSICYASVKDYYAVSGL